MSEETIRGARPWIVVVDDDDGSLKELRRVLGADYRLSFFSGANEALSSIRREGCPDLIITDQRMPEMLGTELLEELVKLHPESVGIIISGFTARHDLVSAINKARVFAYVAKPWRGKYLRETIERALLLSRGRQATLALGKEINELDSGLSAVSSTVSTDRVSVHASLAAVRRQLSELAERSNALAQRQTSRRTVFQKK